jgi:peptidoglycan/xylan/chitin deacetylase (PgdA/CDA1 family)
VKTYPAIAAHGIMFHHFHDARHPVSQGSIAAQELEEILRFIGLQRILTPQEWLARLERGALKPEDLCLTFDDSLLSQIDIALPVLQRHELQAFWFVYSSVFEGHFSRFEIYRAFRSRLFQSTEEFFADFTKRVLRSEFADKTRAVITDEEIARIRTIFPFYSRGDVEFRLIRDHAMSPPEYDVFMDHWLAESGVALQDLTAGLWMNNDHLRQLARDGHMIGLHSYSHPMVMARLSHDEQLGEYEKNLRHIQNASSVAPLTMAHPANSYSDVTLGLLSSLGIRCGFRSNMSTRKPGERLNPDRLELAREDHANIMRLLREKE